MPLKRVDALSFNP